MTRRYFVDTLPADGGRVSFGETESHHAINVMRVRVGEAVTLFDGKGSQAEAMIASIGRREVVCDAESTRFVDLENAVHLTMGIAMPKGDRAKELIERLTELGVNRLVPLHCKRTQWSVPESMIPKWERIVIESCKQSGRNMVLEITQPVALATWLGDAIHSKITGRYFAHPSDDSQSPERAEDRLVNASSSVVAIGPEGGFADSEVEIAAHHGWQQLSLGNRIYRIETAAVLTAIKLARL